MRQGKHIVMSDGSHFITIPRHNPVNALTMGGHKGGRRRPPWPKLEVPIWHLVFPFIVGGGLSLPKGEGRVRVD